MAQNEIHAPLSVLDDTGYPQNFGWSKQPGFYYDPVLVAAPRYRLTESDRYIVSSPTHLVVFEIKDDGLFGNMSISIISLRDKKRSTHVFQSMFPFGDYELPTGSETGSVRWRRKKNHLNITCMDGGVKIIKI